MLSTKIRTTVITLVAATSFGTASIAPAVSHATKNNYGYAKTVGKRKQWHNTCAKRGSLHLTSADTAELPLGRLPAQSRRVHDATRTQAFSSAPIDGASWAGRRHVRRCLVAFALKVTPTVVTGMILGGTRSSDAAAVMLSVTRMRLNLARRRLPARLSLS